MKLGNKGFGWRDFIIYMCILILILLFVAYQINNMYKTIENSKDNNQNQQSTVVPDNKPTKKEEKPKTVDYSYYRELEREFNNATKEYLIQYPTQFDDDMILKIGLDDLVALNFLNEFKNKNTLESCVGYSNVYKTSRDSGYTINSYINCGEYMTEGYR